MFQKILCAKADTVNIPRKSIKGIVLLFKDDTNDPESFSYVKISIEGKLNQIYSHDLTTNILYEEAYHLFSTKMKYDQNVLVFDFYKDSFACIIDLRLNEDNFVYRSGKTVINTQLGILLELTKAAMTKDRTIYIFVVIDGLVNFAKYSILIIVYDIMEQPDCTLIIGPLGSGKTYTLLHEILEN